MSAEREHRAWHLAGHAYAATALGFSVHKLCLEGFSEADLAKRGGAQCLDEGTIIHVPECWSPTGSRERLVRLERLISIALAGPCAELLHREIPCVPANVEQFTVDWTQAWKATGAIWKEESWRRNQLAQWIHSAFAVIFYGVHDFYTPVVSQLLERGTITGVEVQAAWDRLKAAEQASSSKWQRRRRPARLDLPHPESLGPDFMVS